MVIIGSIGLVELGFAQSIDDIPDPVAEMFGCPPGTSPDPNLEYCAPVVDKRNEARANSIDPREMDLPNLEALREPVNNQSLRFQDMPVPQGSSIGAGTVYEVGKLKATTGSLLQTRMIVYPNGIGSISDFIFTTATNRTEKTVEVVGAYPPGSGKGELSIFDWSCSPSDPCNGGKIAPDWVLIQNLNTIPCFYNMEADDGGHVHNHVVYQNQTSAGVSWFNSVRYCNFCTGTWNLVYSHPYGGTLKDCSVDNSCGWWGPIVETFISGTQPSIKELGFRSTLLIHNGVFSFLPESETNWMSPFSPWQTFHRNPNKSWGVGNTTSN